MENISVMGYFDYLWWYKLDDTRENFIKYLIEEMKWSKVEAEDYAKTFY